MFELQPGRLRIRYRSLLCAHSRPSRNKISRKMLFLMDENFSSQCFCTEKSKKCVRPDKDLLIKAALQGRENKIKRPLYRNQATELPGNRPAWQPGCRSPNPRDLPSGKTNPPPLGSAPSTFTDARKAPAFHLPPGMSDAAGDADAFPLLQIGSS